MDAQLRAQLDEVLEALRDELHQQAESWSTIRTPSELFDFEHGLQAVLNHLQSRVALIPDVPGDLNGDGRDGRSASRQRKESRP
jgi:hypothetical protein